MVATEYDCTLGGRFYNLVPSRKKPSLSTGTFVFSDGCCINLPFSRPTRPEPHEQGQVRSGSV